MRNTRRLEATLLRWVREKLLAVRTAAAVEELLHLVSSLRQLQAELLNADTMKPAECLAYLKIVLPPWQDGQNIPALQKTFSGISSSRHAEVADKLRILERQLSLSAYWIAEYEKLPQLPRGFAKRYISLMFPVIDRLGELADELARKV